MNNQRIIGVDPGSSGCGMVVLDNGYIKAAFNVSNELFYTKVTNYLLHPNCVVVIEDIRPYSVRLTMQVIDTAKFIGEVVYRLKCEAGANVVLVTRSQVKKWCFDTFPQVCLPIIEKKIDKKGYITESTGDKRKPSFVFVDDIVVTQCMKELYKIPLPKSGKGYMYGLIKHSWQALAVSSFYINTTPLFLESD